MRELGKMLIFAGAALAALGALVWIFARPGGLPLRLGRLPGDIAYQGKHGSFYFPVVTCILLSVALTLIMCWFNGSKNNPIRIESRAGAQNLECDGADRSDSRYPRAAVFEYVGGGRGFQLPRGVFGSFIFTLKDEKSQVKCVCFRNQAMRLKFRPEDGLKLIVRGSISVYEARGEYQIYVEHIEPSGLGALQLAFDQLRKRLEAEGLFDESRRRSRFP